MKIRLLLATLVWLAACGPKKSRFREIHQNQLRVQLILPGSRDGDYKLRIFPGTHISSIRPEGREKMLYRADSCFYLKKDGLNVYPAYVQTVASGVAQCFEYVVGFGPGAEAASYFVYYDKYYTDKEYLVDLQN